MSTPKITQVQVFSLMVLAYMFSFAIRMIWVYQFQDSPSFMWNNEIMINTNDGYYFAAGAQYELFGTHQENARIPSMWNYGTVFFTVLFTQITPFSLESVTLYMPAIISSIVVVPMILIARLYNQTLWGFLAALLGSIAWSYYNRTMTGYYDTDMFSAMAPMFILYFLMKSTIDFNLKSALYAAIAITVYPFLYEQGKSIVYAMGIIYALYMILYHKNDNETYSSMILVFFALLPLPISAPTNYVVKIIVLIIVFFVFKKVTIEKKKLILASGVLLIGFMYFGNVFGLIISKITPYISTGTKAEGLHFYGVHQTIREAGKIPFSVFANRISGSQIGVLISFIGYIFLVIRYRAFLLALPLIGIGVFALWGGLRFTVYAVPIAAMGAIFLFVIIGDLFRNKKMKYGFIVFGTIMMLYPNITHIIGYKVPTVLNKAEVTDLDKLNKISDSKDYTLTWWDYGYPIWYYSDTNTLIDGGKHGNDNYIISKILLTSSAELAAGLSRLAVETYVGSNYPVVANTIFKNTESKKQDPELLLSELENSIYELPKKTRDIYLYLPYKMLRIFPTVAVFSNLDLITGKKKREIVFYTTQVKNNTKGIISLSNGIVFDSLKGEVTIGGNKKGVKNFIVTQNMKNGKTKLQSQFYKSDGEYAIVYLKSYGKVIVMDTETFNSTYVQMFMLGKYDKNLFELVVSSVYSKIYKLKQ
jgi:dolichyl-diphosphooligosaccharide--protein glycosyltransferase/undecaprenyl-diphosphooligosaccharide--protein glycosyltransferase